MRSFLRRIRATLGNGVLWGIAWFAGSFLAYGGLSLLGVLGYSLGTVAEAALNIGIIGGLAGLGLSAWIRVRYVERTLSEIRLRSFGVSGALASGILVPAIVVLGRFLTVAPPLDGMALLVSGAVAAVPWRRYRDRVARRGAGGSWPTRIRSG
jgi:hypothetical protein